MSEHTDNHILDSQHSHCFLCGDLLAVGQALVSYAATSGNSMWYVCTDIIEASEGLNASMNMPCSRAKTAGNSQASVQVLAQYGMLTYTCALHEVHPGI